MSKYADKHMIHTDRYKPSEKACCERCAFGRGDHAEHCLAARLVYRVAAAMEKAHADNPVRA